MGSALAPPPEDFRIERTKKKFQIPERKINELWKNFCKLDRDGTGYMPMDDFFGKVIRYPRTGLTDQMFRLIDSKSDSALTFGEFVEIIVTFACFEKKELLLYFFYILDPRRTGLIEKTELKHFIIGMWNNEINSNVKESFAYLEHLDDGDSSFNFQEIYGLQLKYPSTFYPLYKLQVHIIDHTFGEVWWENHKAALVEKRDKLAAKELAVLKVKQKEEARANEVVSDEMVQKRMGMFKYYLMPWLREKEKERILKIAAIESELEEKLGL